jgi:hypothetical protein
MMIQEKDIPHIAAPTRTAIAKATVIAAVVAVILLFAAVLPAEYGFDPLRTGAALGLTELARSTATKPAPAISATDGQPQPNTTYTSQPRIYKVDSEDLLLTPGRGVEIKYHMQKGAVMVYSWKASGKVMFEFHGEPDQKPNPDYYDSYELDDKVGKTESYGSFTAPSTGIHGWFWENKGDKNVEIHLTAAGFFDSAKMFAGGDPEDMPLEDAK